DSIPGTPLLETVIRNGATNRVVWQGAAFAASYSIEQSTVSASGPWTVICDQCATDNNTPWIDPTSAAGRLWYRVIAYNLSGLAGNPTNSYQAGSGSRQLEISLRWEHLGKRTCAQQ